MALDLKFQETAQELLVPAMGTENIGPLLYSLVRDTDFQDDVKEVLCRQLKPMPKLLE